MALGVREDVAYLLLKKINEGSQSQSQSEIKLSTDEFSNQEISKKELLTNLDYLNEKAYIQAQFSENQDNANTPSSITLEQASLTDKGRQTLKKMESHSSGEGREHRGSIAHENIGFLEKVMVEANLNDIFDARDLTVTVYRVMRDVMSTEASDRVGSELHTEALQTDNKTLQMEIADLWKDTNPVVDFLNRIREPFKSLKTDDKLFLFRVGQEGGMPVSTDAETVVKAVFSATKEQLSPERITEISGCLPGKVKQLWDQA